LNRTASSVADAGAFSVPREAAGKLGIWLFLSGEIILFGGLIGTFILYRLASPDWAESAKETSVLIGTLNTLVLLTSSLTMVMAHKASTSSEPERMKLWLAWTILLGIVFLCVKSFEWNLKFQHHLSPASGRFWAFYFTMTGLHALHLLAGVVVNSLLALAVLRRRVALAARRVEPAGLYWHFVDVVWIFLFPLFYLG